MSSQDGHCLAEFSTEPLSPSHLLGEDLPLAAAAERIAATRCPVYAVECSAGKGGLQALFPEDVRFAVQDDFASGLVVADVSRVAFTFDSAKDAEQALRDNPRLAGVVVRSAAGNLMIRRELPVVDTAIVMAGGLGQRLRPLTDGIPKPMLEVGGTPLLYRTFELLRQHGITRVLISVNYMAEKIRDAVGDGSRFGIEVEYLEESEPLDTGAGLASLEQVTGPFFVLNGDILTDLDLGAMARQHLLAENLATVATYLFPAPLPYGVMHRDGDRIVEIEEKPVFRYPINAGIYLFAARALDFVAHGKPLAMVDFLNRLAKAGENVGRFALIEYWNDVGSHADYERAQEDVKSL